MGHSAEQVTVRVIDWQQAAADIARAPCTDATLAEPLEYYRQEVEARRMVAFGMFYGNRHVGSFLASVHSFGGRSQLHIEVAGAGNPRDMVTLNALRAYEKMARQYQCRFVRFITCRRGVARKARRFGYEIKECFRGTMPEYAAMKEVGNVQ